MGTSLTFLEAARAAFAATALAAAGHGVVWNPAQPEWVRTSLDRPSVRAFLKERPGVIENWFNLPAIDVDKK